MLVNAVNYHSILKTLATDIYDKDKSYTISLSIIIRQYPYNKRSSLFVLRHYLYNDTALIKTSVFLSLASFFDLV